METQQPLIERVSAISRIREHRPHIRRDEHPTGAGHPHINPQSHFPVPSHVAHPGNALMRSTVSS